MKLKYLFQYFYKNSAVHYLYLLTKRIFFSLFLALIPTVSLALPSYRVVVIPIEEDSNAEFPFKYVTAINDNQQVVGNSDQGSFVYHPEDGLFYFNETLGGPKTRIFDINQSGQLVGRSDTRRSGSSQPFFWDANSGIINLTPSHGSPSTAYHISNSGIVIGTFRFSRGFEWSKDSGLRIETTTLDGNNLFNRGVSDDGTILKESFNFNRSSRFYFLSIPGQKDLLFPSGGSSPKLNHNGVAVDYRKHRKSIYLMDAKTREIIKIFENNDEGVSKINEKLWVLSSMMRNLLFIPGYKSPLLTSSLITEPNGVTDFRQKVINNHGDIAGKGKLNGKEVLVILINENREIQTIQTVAQYSADFANPPAPGWQYHWNPDSKIGLSKDYVNMQWDRWKYDSDGLPGLPDDSELAYGYFSATGGHPGLGASKDIIHDRYVIAGFTVDEAGEYRINDSHVAFNGCDFGNGGSLEIYVNDILVNSFSFDQEEEYIFNGRIGIVNAGSTIFVAVGPNGTDACDGFDWDYTIELVGGSFNTINVNIQTPI